MHDVKLRMQFIYNSDLITAESVLAQSDSLFNSPALLHQIVLIFKLISIKRITIQVKML